jgi:sporulation protein YlmC with PRC-barrel domain
MTHRDPPEASSFRLELFYGRTLVDNSGRRVGRIKDVLAERTASECELTAVLIAPRRLVDLFWLLISALGRHHAPNYERVPWHLLDVSDVRHPRLRCSTEEWRSTNASAR